MNMTPGRTFKGMKMAGRYGGKRATIMSMKIARVMPDEGLILVAGGVPGPKNGVVTLRTAAKGKPAAEA